MPFSYLGIPIGTNPRHSAIWDPVIRKCETKLARWKHKHVSFGGRLTLINSDLTALPIYFLSFLGYLAKLLTSWSTYNLDFYGVRVWNKRRLPGSVGQWCVFQKTKGGLSIKDLWVFNTALLAKWRWVLFHNHGEMCTRILTSKYGGWRSLDDARRSRYFSPWWKDLMQINQQQLADVIKNQIE